jgi:hypothetical protein
MNTKNKIEDIKGAMKVKAAHYADNLPEWYETKMKCDHIKKLANDSYNKGVEDTLWMVEDEISGDLILNYMDMLPPFLNVEGELYFLHMKKHSTKKRVVFEYRTDEDEPKFLDKTFFTGSNILEVARNTINHLYSYDYVKYMPVGYKEKYDKWFTSISD